MGVKLKKSMPTLQLESVKFIGEKKTKVTSWNDTLTIVGSFWQKALCFSRKKVFLVNMWNSNLNLFLIVVEIIINYQ